MVPSNRGGVVPRDVAVAGASATSLGPGRRFGARLRALAVASAVALLISGCGATPRPGTRSVRAPAPASAPRPADHGQPAAPAAPPVIRVARTAYGPALTDQRGFALYSFTRDQGASSACYGDCATAWPPYVVATRSAASGSGARVDLLGFIPRRDGHLQVTYAGHPLYYYVGDRRPGQILCQGVREFGGVWDVVAPDGRAIQ